MKDFSEALEIAKARDNEIWMAYAHQGLAETHHSLANKGLAQQHYKAAYELYIQNNALVEIKKLEVLMDEQGYKIPKRIVG